jgi:hypothetical protein
VSVHDSRQTVWSGSYNEFLFLTSHYVLNILLSQCEYTKFIVYFMIKESTNQYMLLSLCSTYIRIPSIWLSRDQTGAGLSDIPGYQTVLNITKVFTGKLLMFLSLDCTTNQKNIRFGYHLQLPYLWSFSANDHLSVIFFSLQKDYAFSVITGPVTSFLRNALL